jgi:CRISPR-associated protein Cas1
MCAASQSAGDPAADLLPARMLNEFVYCPRLFYYEHVEGVFLHSADTKRGAAEHARVDAGRGELPKAKKKAEDTPSAEASGEASDEQEKAGAVAVDAGASPIDNEVIHARSVMLGSELLGVVAKLDLVDITLEGVGLTGQGGAQTVSTVCPVEYKSGAPREGDGGRELWDADRIQLGLQILLLRENGYHCDEGVVFYRQTRQRVRFVLTADDEDWIRRSIGAARACTAGPIPPPLDHSPKCPRCSLAPVCLPDETQFLHMTADDELPAREAQLALPGLTGEVASSDVAVLAEALETDIPAWETLPEPRLPRVAGEGEVRRLIAPDVDTKVLYVNTPGVMVSRKGETVVVKEGGDTLAEVRIKDLHHLAVFGAASISTALIQTLCENEVPVSYFSMGGWFYGLTRGHGLTNVFTRIRQFARAADPEQALPIARLFVYGKIRNQRTLLMRNHVEPPPLALRALKYAASAALVVPGFPTLLGIEGAAALVYFRNFGGMIKGSDDNDDIPGLEETVEKRVGDAQKEFNFDFKTRNRRPPRDPVNALLSLAYSLLARDCTVAALAVGFDPYIGLYHQPRFGRPALALDVMEEFRPLIADSTVLTAINNRMIAPTDFVQAGDAVNLTPAGRKRFSLAYEKRMSDTITHPLFDYKVSYRRAIELQFRLLARTLTGEIECYMPFTTR